MNWQEYKAEFTTTEYDNPEGRATMFVRGPKGGAYFAGNFTPDELDQHALDAAHTAERIRSGGVIESRPKAA